LSVGAGVSIRLALTAEPAIQKQHDGPAPTAENSNKTKDDLADMEGTWVSWETVTETVNGVTKPPRNRKITWAISGGKIIEAGEDGRMNEQWTIKLDQTKSPRAIDLSSPRLGTSSGIYVLEADSLRIYLELDGKRPSKIPLDADMRWNLKRVSR